MFIDDTGKRPSDYYDIPLKVESTHFIVYYDEAESTKTMANLVAQEYEKIYNYFCTQLKFLPGSTYTSGGRYEVYIDGVSGGTTPPLGDGCSYISIGSGTIFDMQAGETQAVAVLAHEYMHAIAFTYGATWTTGNYWFHESFAAMAGIVYCPEGAGAYTSPDGSLTIFLKNQNVPINDDEYYHRYGALVFPLYVYENLGGWNTIKNILLAFGQYKDSLDAIDSGLRATKSSYSLKSALEDVYLYCCDVSHFYSLFKNLSAEKVTPNSDATYTHTGGISTTNTAEVKKLAASYTKFGGVPQTARVYVSNTLQFTGSAASSVVVKSLVKSVGGAYSVSTYTPDATGRCTIQQYLGDANSEMYLVVENLSSNATVSYRRSTSYYFVPFDGSKYQLQNVGSGSYLSASSIALGANVNQKAPPLTVRSNWAFSSVSNLTYRMNLVSATQWYLSTGLTTAVNGTNVTIQSSNDAYQKWIVVMEEFGQYRISPAANSYLALTIYPGGDGTAAGTSPTSVGNAYVSVPLDDEMYTSYQLWKLVPIIN